MVYGVLMGSAYFILNRFLFVTIDFTVYPTTFLTNCKADCYGSPALVDVAAAALAVLPEPRYISSRTRRRKLGC